MLSHSLLAILSLNNLVVKWWKSLKSIDFMLGSHMKFHGNRSKRYSLEQSDGPTLAFPRASPLAWLKPVCTYWQNCYPNLKIINSKTLHSLHCTGARQKQPPTSTVYKDAHKLTASMSELWPSEAEVKVLAWRLPNHFWHQDTLNY